MSDFLNIPVAPGVKIAVVGDLHEQERHFDQLLERINPTPGKMVLVSVGDLYDKGKGPSHAESMADKIKILNQDEVGFIVRGNHELKHIRRYKKNLTPQLQWLQTQPLVLSFVFDNGSRVTVLHGGVKPKHTWADLSFDLEVAYLRDLDQDDNMIRLQWIEKDNTRFLQPAKPGGVSWHTKYDGRFGYIAAGHEPQVDGIPKFYNHSCNLDTSCYSTGVLSCQVFGSQGREELIQIR